MSARQLAQRKIVDKTGLAVWLVLLSLSLLVGAAVSSYADAPHSGAPLSAVRTGVDRVIAVFDDQSMSLAQRREKLRAMSWEYFDFRDMAQSALGYHWRALTPAQKAQFVPLFTGFIQDAYLSKMEQATVEKVRQAAKTAVVQFTRQDYFGHDYAEVYSTVALHDQDMPLKVNYMMHRGAGAWRIYDISIDNISLIANYRDQFNRVINGRGFPALLAELQAKRRQLQRYINQEARDSIAR